MEELEHELIQLEYKSLREEILQNKNYVFERPLLILTAFAIALSRITELGFIQLLIFTLIFMLSLNLWFTANRLSSGARISAYLDMMIEGSDYSWVGWEKSLRLYRIWMKKYKPAEREEKIRAKMVESAIPDAMMFYPQIYYFHAVIVLMAFIASGYSAGIFIIGSEGPLFNTLLLNYPWNLDIICFLSNLLIAILFLFSAAKYNPLDMRKLMERNRAIWELVSDETELKKKKDVCALSKLERLELHNN